MEKIRYRDERMWPHPFPSIISDLPNKLFNMEEARGDIFSWKTLN